MRIYISGRISGNGNAGSEFREAFQKVREMYPDADIFNPMEAARELGKSLHFDYDDYMRIDMAFLQLCDAVAMIPGWESSRGANREYGYATGTGMQVILL